jgi:hypothetical protein
MSKGYIVASGICGTIIVLALVGLVQVLVYIGLVPLKVSPITTNLDLYNGNTEAYRGKLISATGMVNVIVIKDELVRVLQYYRGETNYPITIDGNGIRQIR